jgi:murein DD-endopeptidase MepM/ murein hydrolase activator NlpD
MRLTKTIVIAAIMLAGIAVWVGRGDHCAPAPSREGMIAGERTTDRVAGENRADRSPPPIEDTGEAPDAVMAPATEQPNLPQPTPSDRSPDPVTSDGASGAKEAELPAPDSESESSSLSFPIDGIDQDRLIDNFDERRGGNRRHEALDILAPRNTPVRAVADGTIAKLFESVPGGHTIYQFDPQGRYCYYYAHLERYARGLREGDVVERGDVIGYVGTSGNAPPDVPHLHFAIYRLGPERRWWEGEPVNPFPLLRDAGSGQ